MKVGGRAEDVWLVRKHTTAVGQTSLQVLDRGEALVRDSFVAQRPEVLGRLHLGRVGWLELDDDSVGDGEVGTGMPSRTVQGEQDHLVGPYALLLGEGGQHRPEDLEADRGDQIPSDSSTGWMDEADQVKPLIAVPHGRMRTLAVWCPDLSQDRLQPDAVLIRPPRFHHRVRVLRLYFGPALWQPLL